MREFKEGGFLHEMFGDAGKARERVWVHGGILTFMIVVGALSTRGPWETWGETAWVGAKVLLWVGAFYGLIIVFAAIPSYRTARRNRRAKDLAADYYQSALISAARQFTDCPTQRRLVLLKELERMLIRRDLDPNAKDVLREMYDRAVSADVSEF